MGLLVIYKASLGTGLSIAPKKGTGVFWYNMDASKEPHTWSKHAGCPTFATANDKYKSVAKLD